MGGVKDRKEKDRKSVKKSKIKKRTEIVYKLNKSKDSLHILLSEDGF